MFRVLRQAHKSTKALKLGQKQLIGHNKISNLSMKSLSTTSRCLKGEMYEVTYVIEDGESITVPAKEGDNLLDIAINNNVEIDGFGACEGTLACSTCHLIFNQKDFDNIEDVATDEELDMLDLAFGLTDTSRLGCQVCMTKELDKMVVRVPEGVNDQR